MTTTQTIQDAVARLGKGALCESALVEHIHPLFSRVLERNARTGEIYLANHSLGRPLDASALDVQECMDHWYNELDEAWGPWLAERESYRARIASLIGCARTDCVVPKTSAGQGLRAVINALPDPHPKILATRGEFDSIDFILKSYAHKNRADVDWVAGDQDGAFDPTRIITRIDNTTDLVVLSMIVFATGQMIEGIEQIIESAHTHGAKVLIDAYHAFGVVPIGFDDLNADFVIGGNYKYTRGGAGACFLAIHPDHLSNSGGVPPRDALFTTDTGWFAKQDPFSYKRTDAPAYSAGGDAWLEATPPVLTYYQARAGLALVNAIGVDRLRAYSLIQRQLLTGLFRDAGIATRVHAEHGAFVLVAVRDGPACMDAIRAAGVNIDGRPDPTTGEFLLRFCPDLLTTQHEMGEAVSRSAPVIRSFQPVGS